MLAGWLTKASVNVQLLADSLNLLALNVREEWPDGHFSWFKLFFFQRIQPQYSTNVFLPFILYFRLIVALLTSANGSTSPRSQTYKSLS